MAGIYLEKPHESLPVTEVMLHLQEGKTRSSANTCKKFSVKNGLRVSVRCLLSPSFGCKCSP